MTKVTEFIHELKWDALPAPVQSMAQRCLKDTLGVALAASVTRAARISAEFALQHHSPTNASRSRLFAQGGESSVPGAAMAGAIMVDSVDAHDGHRLCKGHAGSAVVPSLVSMSDHLRQSGRPISGKALLEALIVGYEVSIRCALQQHATVPDYHASGSWTAVGVAAMCSRLLGLSPAQTEEAVGIAEYHGPRSQMMRLIDYPSMVKDSVGAGAQVGVSSAFMASLGFTGAPAITLTEADEQDYGERFEMLYPYFKPWPVCRWAQPPMEGLHQLMQAHDLAADNIQAIHVETFHEAVRLENRRPKNTEEAQYSLGFPVAAYAVRGKLGVREVSEDGIQDPAIARMQKRITLAEKAEHNHDFPDYRRADVHLTLNSGEHLSVESVEARGDFRNPLSDEELDAKFDSLVGEVLSPEQRTRLVETLDQLPRLGSVTTLLDQITDPT